MNAPDTIQIINGVDGKPAFIVIPYAEYMRTQQAEPDQQFVPDEVLQLVALQAMTAVRAWRVYLGLTQAGVAARIGISQSAYAQQEASATNRRATRRKIAAALGIRPEQLDLRS